MNREILVSVIIPTYNRCGLLERAIRTVLEQSLPANEIIVVDDGSKKGLLDKIKAKFPQIIWRRQKNKGVAATRNYGSESRVNGLPCSIRMMNGIHANLNVRQNISSEIPKPGPCIQMRDGFALEMK